MKCRNGKKISILLLSMFVLNIIFICNVDVAMAYSGGSYRAMSLFGTTDNDNVMMVLTDDLIESGILDKMMSESGYIVTKRNNNANIISFEFKEPILLKRLQFDYNISSVSGHASIQFSFVNTKTNERKYFETSSLSGSVDEIYDFEFDKMELMHSQFDTESRTYNIKNFRLYGIPVSDFSTDPEPLNLKFGDIKCVTGYNDVVFDFKIDGDVPEGQSYSIKAYRNDEFLDTFDGLSFKDSDLEIDTEYNYKFELVVDDEVVNTKAMLVRTKYKDVIPPAVPSGITSMVGNGFIALDWKSNTEDDFCGYNVYLNGKKINNDLLSTNKYVIYGIENDVTHFVQVSAVDTSGNESVLSEKYSFVCDGDSIPYVHVGVNTKDITDGTLDMFSSLWPIIAFLVGIPIAFYVGINVKKLFLGG